MADVCGQVLLGSGLTVLSHPLMYIKVLIQVSGTCPVVALTWRLSVTSALLLGVPDK